MQAEAGRKLEGDFLGPRGMFDAAAHPFDIGWADAEVVFQNRARPHIGCQLVFRETHFPSCQVLRFFDPVGAHENRGVPKTAGYKGRNSHIGALTKCGFEREARQRQLANVEIHGAEGAEENFFGHEFHEHRIDAVDFDRSVDQRAVAVVIPNRDGEVEQRHNGSLFLSPALT